jgi:hypothetical protein
MAIAVPGVVVSTNDVISIENALDSLFAVQNETTGMLPYAGRPFDPSAVSFTYHLYTLIGVADHYLYTVSRISVELYHSLTEAIRETSNTSPLCGTSTNSPCPSPSQTSTIRA